MPAKDVLSRNKKLVSINTSAIKGEPGTGYEGEDGLGEFECENCKFFRASESSCGQKDMMQKSKQPRLKNGRVKVDKEGCCEYVARIGKKDKD